MPQNCWCFVFDLLWCFILVGFGRRCINMEYVCVYEFHLFLCTICSYFKICTFFKRKHSKKKRKRNWSLMCSWYHFTLKQKMTIHRVNLLSLYVFSGKMHQNDTKNILVQNKTRKVSRSGSFVILKWEKCFSVSLKQKVGFDVFCVATCIAKASHGPLFPLTIEKQTK